MVLVCLFYAFLAFISLLSAFDLLSVLCFASLVFSICFICGFAHWVYCIFFCFLFSLLFSSSFLLMSVCVFVCSSLFSCASTVCLGVLSASVCLVHWFFPPSLLC